MVFLMELIHLIIATITNTRVKKLQQTLYTYIQVMVRSSKKILEDVGDLPYILCKVEFQERDELNAL